MHTLQDAATGRSTTTTRSEQQKLSSDTCSSCQGRQGQYGSLTRTVAHIVQGGEYGGDGFRERADSTTIAIIVVALITVS